MIQILKSNTYIYKCMLLYFALMSATFSLDIYLMVYKKIGNIKRSNVENSVCYLLTTLNTVSRDKLWIKALVQLSWVLSGTNMMVGRGHWRLVLWVSLCQEIHVIHVSTWKAHSYCSRVSCLTSFFSLLLQSVNYFSLTELYVINL